MPFGASPPSPLHPAWLPISILTDSYKTTHFLQYPKCTKMVAYGEFRRGYYGDAADTRLVVWGLRYILEHYVARRWTREEVELADRFYAGHRAPSAAPFPYPRDLFLKFIEENDGYMPVRLQALPEGSVVHARVPIFQITAEGEYAPLCTFLETLLTQVWYPVSVATLSRRCKEMIAAAFDRSVEGGRASPLLNSRLHDFGMRGCTCVEQSVLGGVAHLLNFDGTDTLPAAYYAQFALNDGRPVGESIPATEHSVMTSWPSERAAISNMITNFGDGIYATVMDSYDYQRALDEVLPAVAAEKVAAGGFWVLRPDSGDPVDAVLAGLRGAERAFGADTNSLGFRVLRGVGVIQGDGIDYANIKDILEAVMEAGYSVQSVAFGMGGGLLQKVNRDTLSLATKLSHIVYADGTVVDTMKAPKTGPEKGSLPGVLAVKRVNGVPTVFPADEVAPEEDLLQVVYDKRPLAVEWESFDELRERVESEWTALPPCADVLSASLRAKRDAVAARLGVQGQFVG
ncbi:nicotinate phosphoribosyltransferase [Micractinium conductrix]|uniref:Nicotinamide phosphoribosyltransferase n=1 Tax=Micractinium conductrix TaxID=554055 RepID=A0A2P6V320_9CHLO|nr:nicotinate phosphoribosyltransferase [Micractinium conductrix]|eukprot:PSC68478.1 nicotinate phosphoribosyltransferase [Micractinium conductrix]